MENRKLQLVLDPLIRLHRLDENSSSDISRLLGFLRELQRTFDTAIVLVHHAAKKHRAQPGQALRGSSDLHAFGDSNAYLARRGEQLILTLEHRSAASPPPITLALVSRADGSATHLEPVAGGADNSLALAERVLALLQNSPQPFTRAGLRERLKVNNQRLGEALAALEQQGAIRRTAQGWTAPRPIHAPEAPPAPRTSPRHPPHVPSQCTLALEPPGT